MANVDEWNKVATAFLQKQVDSWLDSPEGLAAKRLMKNAEVDLVLFFVEKKEEEPWSKFFVFNQDGLQKFSTDEDKEKLLLEVLHGEAKESRMIERGHRGYAKAACAEMFESNKEGVDGILYFIRKKIEEFALSVKE